jgi:hypothetical protein
MAIGSQTVQFPFAGGVDEKTAAEFVDPNARLIDAENAVFTHDGALEKRLGVAGLSTSTPLGGTMGTPLKLATRGSELLAFDGAAAWSYSTGVGGWVSRGSVPYCQATRSHLYTNAAQTGMAGFSIAEGSGIRLVAWRTVSGSGTSWLPGDVYISIYDTSTGASLVTSQAMTSGAIYYNPTVIILGSYGYLFYSDNAGNLYGRVLTLSTLTWGSVTTIVSDMTPTASGRPGFIFDAVPYAPAGGGILIAYGQRAPYYPPVNARYLRLEALPALTISGSATLTAYTQSYNMITLVSCRVDTSLNIAWVAWEYQNAAANSYSVQGCALNATTWAVLGGPFTVGFPVPYDSTKTAGQLSVEPYDATSALFVGPQYGARYDDTGSSHAQCCYSPPAYTTNPASGPPGLGRVASRPFRVTVAGQTKWLLVFALWQEYQYNQEAQAVTYLLIDALATGSGLYDGGYLIGHAVATLAPRQGNYAYAYNAGTYDLRPPSVTSPCDLTAGTYRALIGVNASEEFYSPPQVLNPPAGTCFIDLAEFDFTGATCYSFAEGSGETFISGGVPSFYDGAAVQEIGFLQWPSSITYTTGTSGNLGTGTYEYTFLMAALDNSGLITRSTGWTTTITFGSGSTNSVSFSIPFPAYTAHQNSGRAPVIEVFRTEANGTTLYYEGNISAFPSMGPGTLSYTSTASDTSIATNDTLYTTGGVLDAVNPPSFRHTIEHVGRLFGIDDTGFVIWYSTPFGPSDAPYFNEVLTLQFTDEVLTALASLDFNLIAFSAKHIWYVQGTGPNNLGQNSDFQQAVLIPSDVGCADWRSVVRFPQGVLFQAPSGGIYMLDRGFNVTYIGKDVQDLTSGATVVAASLTPTSNQVRFLLSSGVVITWDYVLQRWARNVYGASLGTFTTAITANNTSWCAASSSGTVYQEKTTAAAAPWYDTTAGGSNVWITLAVTTAHVKLVGLQGYQRSRHTMGYAHWLEAADQQVTLTFDYGESTQTATFTYGNLYAANQIAAQWDLHTQALSGKAAAVQVTWSDAPPTGGTATTGRGVRMLGLAFEAQVLEQRYRKLPASVKA